MSGHTKGQLNVVDWEKLEAALGVSPFGDKGSIGPTEGEAKERDRLRAAIAAARSK